MSDIRFDNNETIDSKFLSLAKPETQRARYVLEANLPANAKRDEQTLAVVKACTSTNVLSVQNQERASSHVLGAKEPRNVLEALQKSSAAFRDDKNNMLEAISKNHNAYEYASKRLQNDSEFLVAAIQKNPAVYSHLPIEKKLDPEFHKAYEQRMFRDVVKEAVGQNNSLNIPKQAIDKDFPFDEKKYGVALARNADNVLEDPTSQTLLTKERTYMAAAQHAATQNPILKDKLLQIEKDFYTSPELQERSLKISATQSRMHSGVDAFLQKMEEANPQLSKEYARRQEEYWLRQPERKTPEQLAEMTRQERQRENARRLQEQTPLVKLAQAYAYQDRMSRSHRFDRDADMDRDAEKTIKEAEKRVKDQKAREACLDYLKIACKDYIYGLASDGRISQEDASMCVSLIDGIPSVTKATYTYSNLAHASINDFDNGDFHITPVEVDDLKRSIVSTDAQLTRVEEQIKTAEQEATNRIDDSYLFRAPEGYDRKREQKYNYHG